MLQRHFSKFTHLTTPTGTRYLTGGKGGNASSSGPVLVVGGSLVGLSTALFLRSQGVPVIVVDPHLQSSPHPRAIGYTSRTLELIRAHHLGPLVPQAPPGFRLRRRRVPSLVVAAATKGEEVHWSAPPPPKESSTPRESWSPCTGAAIAQDRLEPILRDRAVALGAELRLGSWLESFDQDEAGVVARIVDKRTNERQTLRVPFMVACDGAKSPVREALGIQRKGRGVIQVVRSVVFRERASRLEPYLADGVHQFEIEGGTFLTTYNDGRWLAVFKDDQPMDEPSLVQAIHRAVGRTDLEIEILATGQWEVGALVAERFSQGRVFLAGDAAHALPPNRAGYGANTGIHDAHNLAWKLQHVLAGRSDARLLGTYHDERHPVAWQRMVQIFLRPDYGRFGTEGVLPPDGNGNASMLDDDAMEFGQVYRSAAVQGPADTAAPPPVVGVEAEAALPSEWKGFPGTRFPHFWVGAGPTSAEKNKKEKESTLDLITGESGGWTLFLGSHEGAGRAWRGAALRVATQLRIPLTPVGPGVEFHLLPDHHHDHQHQHDRWEASLGISPTGAVLVRPDGHIAWRFVEIEGQELERTVRTVAFCQPLN